MTELSIFDLDDSFQIRVATSEEKIDQYAEYFLERGEWGDFPAIDVVQIDGRFIIADGIHRFNAAKRAGFETVPCNITNGVRLDLYRLAIVTNGKQGLSMSREDHKNFRRKLLEEYANGTVETSLEEIANLDRCHPRTVARQRDQMQAEGFTFPETTIGKDGKAYPTKYQKPGLTNVKGEKPPQTSPARPTVPTDGPEYTLCPQCGTPIWPENMGNPDYTYTEQGGRWFCCPDCADEWESSQKSAAATDLTGIPETLPPIPSAALPTRPNPSLEPEHPARPVDPEETDPFTDVDVSTLPEYEPKEQENNSCFLECAFTVQVFGTTDPEEAVAALKECFPHRFGKNDRDFLLKFLGLCINNNINLNTNNNINQEIFSEKKPVDSEKFTQWKIKARGKKSLTTVTISKKKYEEWNKKFGRTIDIDATLDECCSYYNDLQGDDIISAGVVYSKVFTWLNTNAKREKKEKQTPKRSSRSEYPDAGVRFDPAMYE